MCVCVHIRAPVCARARARARVCVYVFDIYSYMPGEGGSILIDDVPLVEVM